MKSDGFRCRGFAAKLTPQLQNNGESGLLVQQELLGNMPSV